jgi:DNA-binding transcriptional MerR regulator
MEEHMKRTYLIGDLSKRLGVRPYRIAYLYTTRRLPEPVRIGNRRHFSEADARQVAKALGLSWNPEKEGHE